MPRRRPTSHRTLRIASAALMAVLATAGIAWAWNAVTLNPNSSVTAAVIPPPGSVNATDPGGPCTTINVTWASVAGATDYRVERQSENGAPEVRNASTGNVTSWSDNAAGPNNNFTWTYQVYAKRGGTSTWESVAGVDATPLTCGIGEIDDLVLNNNCSTTTTLTWTHPTGSTRYDIWRSVNGGTFTMMGAGNQTTLLYTDTTIHPPHATVSYYVVPGGTTLNGTPSNTLSVNDYGCLVPATNLTATQGCTGPNTVLSWTAAPNATSYNVRRRENGGTWGAGTTTVTGTTRTETQTQTAGRTYEYGLFSRNGALVDDVLSGTASIVSGFVVQSVEFGDNGAAGTVDVGDTVTVTFSRPVSAGRVTGTQIRTLSGTGSRGIYLSATGTTAATTAIGFIRTGTGDVATATLNGTVVWNSDRTVWTWTSTTGGVAADLSALSTWTAGGNTTLRPTCNGTATTLAAYTPTYSGSW